VARRRRRRRCARPRPRRAAARNIIRETLVTAAAAHGRPFFAYAADVRGWRSTKYCDGIRAGLPILSSSRRLIY